MILHADDPPGAIAVSLLYGYTLDEKEARIARLIGGYAPGVAVTLSGRVAPECREFEGTSTTVLNAYLMPLHRPRA